ncbi:hypothetical protein [Streptomyces sp. 4F14]
MPAEDLPALLESQRVCARPAVSGPRSLGMGRSGHSDSSERVGETL